MNSDDIENIIMGSVAQRDREFIVRCIGRHAGQSDNRKRPLSVFETYEVDRASMQLQARTQGSAWARMALQEYRSVAVLGQARS